MSNLWYQCRLRQGATETVGWIEKRGAREGANVELLTEAFDSGVWLVVDVYPHGIGGETLREKQAIDRKGMPDFHRRRTNA